MVERAGGANGLTLYRRHGIPKNVLPGNSIFEVKLSGKAPKKAVPLYDLYGHAGGAVNYFVDQGFPAWSPSGTRLAFTRNGDIWIATLVAKEPDDDQYVENWDVTRVAPVAVYDEPTLRASRWNLGATTLSWTPDEKHLLYGYERVGGTGAEEAHLLDIGSGKSIKLPDRPAVINPILSPDGKFFVYWSYDCDKGEHKNCIWINSIDGKIKQEIIADGEGPNW
jgi:Tol biopolymer transport system component